MEEIQGSSEAKARLLTKLKAGLKYAEGRLKRLEDNREAMLEEERKRRLKHEKDMADIEKKIMKEKNIVEDKKAKIISEWEAGERDVDDKASFGEQPPAAAAVSAPPTPTPPAAAPQLPPSGMVAPMGA